MSEREQLIAAVLAEPREFTPRLAFADWLDENGDAADREWARLIRFPRPVTLESHGAGRWQVGWSGQSPDVTAAAYGLVEALGIPDEYYTTTRLTVRHGFVESLRLGGWGHVPRVAGVFASHPVRSLLTAVAEPYRFTPPGREWQVLWLWRGVDGPISPDQLPKPVFRRVCAARKAGNAVFARRYEALRAAGIAAADWGRELAAAACETVTA